MSYQKVLAEVTAGQTIIIDAATGTELQRRGAPMHSEVWCAMAIETSPQILQSIHEDYIRCGARVVTANTFATTREVLEPGGFGHKFETFNRSAVELAVAAREAVKTRLPVLVAGSISHTRPVATGEFLPKASNLEKFEADCTEMAAIHKAAGCDLILAEMMGDVDYTPCVIRAAKANDLPVWVGLSARRGPDGVLGTYTDQNVPFAEVLAPITAQGLADVMGVMHSKAEVTLPALEMLKEHWSGPLMAYPDSIDEVGESVAEMTLDGVIGEDDFVSHCVSWRDAGVRILGGCCGLTVSHISALSARLGISNDRG